MKKTLPTLAVLAAALAVTGACLAGAMPGAKISLKQKYVPGSYVQTVAVDIEQVTAFGANEMKAQTSQESTIAVVISKPDKTGNKKMTWQYKRIKQTVSVAGRTMSYDSDAPEKGDPNLANALGALSKAKIALIIGPDEKIKKVTGMDEMWDELGKKDPASAPMMANMKKTMGNQMMKDMAEKFGQLMPAKPVAVGEQWVNKNDLDVPVLGKLAVEMKCRLKKVESAPTGKRAVISIAGKIESVEPKTVTAGMATMTVRNVVITMTGENKLSIDNPMLSEMTLVQDGSMEMQMQGQGGQAPAMTSKFKNKMVIRAVKAPPSKNAPGK